MKRTELTSAILLLLLSIGCSTTVDRPDQAALRNAVAQGGSGAPRLPAAGEGYLDPGWFEQTLSAERLVQAALLNNPRVRAELSRLDAAQAGRVQAGLLGNPMASLMVLRPEGGGRFELDYGLMQSLFDLFTRARRMAVADAAQQRIEAEVIGQLLALAQDSEAAYYEVLAIQQGLGLQRERLAYEQQSLRLLQSQASLGAVPGSVVLEQDAATATQAHQTQSAELALLQARTALAQLLGLSSASPLRLPSTLPAFVMPGLDASALQTMAAIHRPELQATAAATAQAHAERALETGALRATEPALGPSGVRESDGFSLNGVAIELSLPIFDNGRARRELASANLAQAQFAAEAVRRRVPLEVELALATLVTGQMAADQAGRHLQQQRQFERLAQATYQQGNIDLLAYRQASRARLDAEQAQLEAQQMLWAAAVGLQRATGIAVAAQGLGVSPTP